MLQFAQNAPRKRGCKGLRVPLSKDERDAILLDNLTRQEKRLKDRKAAILRDRDEKKKQIGVVKATFNEPATNANKNPFQNTNPF